MLEKKMGNGLLMLLLLPAKWAINTHPHIPSVKHAVIGFTQALAHETATQGVTVNAVCPSFEDTRGSSKVSGTYCGKKKERLTEKFW